MSKTPKKPTPSSPCSWEKKYRQGNTLFRPMLLRQNWIFSMRYSWETDGEDRPPGVSGDQPDIRRVIAQRETFGPTDAAVLGVFYAASRLTEAQATTKSVEQIWP